ncbi:related to Nuclear cap-binding protein complex subunit 1 [Saccharomycodes ludwigii]|uniref:Nuclear cap-binding protein complex subunit 1 n=2 Tax=Saccharomycodes ludwigii TaxID=36035 RepID=A0A376B2U5_9ASCO|nr:related to Nuclear cap-binding protein complex subunit 1 [Saccharomycodes ludwigii]
MILYADPEDDDYSGINRDFRPRVQKRQRLPPVVELCRQMMPDICTIGESISAFEEDIKFLGEAIVSEFNNEEYFRNALLSTLYAVVVEQPQKQQCVALLIISINARDSVVGKSIINFFYGKLQEWCDLTCDEENLKITSNETGPWNKIKLILRLLALLSPILIEDDLVSLFKNFLDISIQLNNEFSEEERCPLSEAIYYNTLINVPYLFFFKGTSHSSLYTKIQELLDSVSQNYKIKPKYFSLLDEYNRSAPYERVELIEHILIAVKKSIANDFAELNFLFVDYNHLLPDQPADVGFNDPLRLPSINDMKPYSAMDKGLGSIDSVWKTPRYDFKVYLMNPVGNFNTVPDSNSYGGLLLNDITVDIVESLEFNRKQVAKQVVTLDLFFRQGFFSERGQSIAQLIDIQEENPTISTYKVEDLAVQNILSLIFKLPTQSQSFAYFYTLLVEICDNSPKYIAPVFGRAFRFFYNNLENLDVELKLRYLDWFSIQMSNFNFSWKWNEWEAVSMRYGGVSFYNSKINFIKNLIRKELRLTSNKADVEESLTEEFLKYVDTSFVPFEILKSYYASFFNGFEINQEELKPSLFYFLNYTFPFTNEVQEVIDYLHKSSEERNLAELKGIFKKIEENHGSIITDINRFTVSLLTQAIVYSGSRSLSHANKYINEYKNDFIELLSMIEVDTHLKQMWIVEATLRYWNNNSQTGFLVCDMFKNTGIIDPLIIARFLFSDYEKGKTLGLVETTCLEAVFRLLNSLSLMKTPRLDIFEFVFERLSGIINETLPQLGITAEEEVPHPNLDSNDDDDNDDDDDENNTMFDESEIPRFDLIWRYEAASDLIKSLLRRYSDEYTLLLDKLKLYNDNNMTNVPTRRKIGTWLDEMKKL